MSKPWTSEDGGRTYIGDTVMERHHEDFRKEFAGVWRFSYCGGVEASDWLGVSNRDVRAVMDDHGNLVRVR